MLILSVVHCSPCNIGRDQNRRNANSDQVEAKGRIDANLTVRAGNLWLVGKRVIVDAAVLVPKDHEQSLLPLRRIAQRFVHVCNQDVSQADIVVGVLVVLAVSSVLMYVAFLLYLVSLVLHLVWGWSALICAVILTLAGVFAFLLLRVRLRKPLFQMTLKDLGKDKEWLSQSKTKAY